MRQQIEELDRVSKQTSHTSNGKRGRGASDCGSSGCGGGWKGNERSAATICEDLARRYDLPEASSAAAKLVDLRWKAEGGLRDGTSGKVGIGKRMVLSLAIEKSKMGIGYHFAVIQNRRDYTILYLYVRNE
ncbi:unnamed protein product [Linum trigynum]|uniref:Uncharacterized protein n=1 Tax=Linum trigynum TaxID=586398 RepID=A0AAV2D0L4_9ROSI